MINTNVYKDWESFFFDGECELIEELESKGVCSIELAIGYDENEEQIFTGYLVEDIDGNEYELPGNDIWACLDPVSCRGICEDNYEIYLELLRKLRGMEFFENYNSIPGHETYLQLVTEAMADHADVFEGVLPCTEEELWQVEILKRIAERDGSFKILRKGCEVCPNKACKIHP